MQLQVKVSVSLTNDARVESRKLTVLSLLSGNVGLVFPVFVISAIINRILYRIQLVPMRDYTYFISQFSCVCYVVIYGIILLRRVRKDIVTPPMLAYARRNVKVRKHCYGPTASTVGIALKHLAGAPAKGGIEARNPSCKAALGKGGTKVQN